MYDYGARFYEPSIGIFISTDPLSDSPANVSYSPYHYVWNNPIRFIDPTGMHGEDFVQRADGSIYWDNNANSQETTKQGETYLGKSLSFKFNSNIDADLWDGPGGDVPAGNKLTSTISITASENSKGELTGISATKDVVIGPTPVGTGRDYFPGLGDEQNKFTSSQSHNADGTLSSFDFNFEQHASVSPIEHIGLNFMGYDIVNVAQKVNLNYSNGNLGVSAGTDVFPSASLSVNGNNLFNYKQPSFNATHGRNPSKISRSPHSPAAGTARRPSPQFYTRYKN